MTHLINSDKRSHQNNQKQNVYRILLPPHSKPYLWSTQEKRSPFTSNRQILLCRGNLPPQQDLAIKLVMDGKISAKLTLFMLTFRRSLTLKGITCDDYFTENRPNNIRSLSRYEFSKMVEKFSQTGSPFTAIELFQQLTKDNECVELETFKAVFVKVSRISAPRGNDAAKQKEKQYARRLQEDSQKTRLLKVGLDRLQAYMNSGDDPDQIFKDCDLDGSGDIDRQEFNKFLVASEIYEFNDKDIRRLLINDLFAKYGKERITKQEFFTEFKMAPKTSPVIKKNNTLDLRGGRQNPEEKEVSKENARNRILFRIKNKEKEKQKQEQMEKQREREREREREKKREKEAEAEREKQRERQREMERQRQRENQMNKQQQDKQRKEREEKQRKEREEKLQKQRKQREEERLRAERERNKPKPAPVNENVIEDHRKYFQSYKKDFPLASKYYRLGVPTSDEIAYVQELERLLASGKTFTDPKNPGARGPYAEAAKIFKNQKYDLISMAPSVLNRERNRLGIGQFIEIKDVQQGMAGDCYFMSMLGSLTSKCPELISQLLLFDVNPAKYCAVKLFVDGQWRIIKTDQRFATIQQTQFMYARSHCNEIWAMLIEKCFAKIYGSYDAIYAGSSQQAFILLTGAPYGAINFQQQKDKESLKKKIKQATDKGYIMTTSDNAYMKSLSKQTLNSLGLVKDHVYSLLGVYEAGNETIVKLRNPSQWTVWKGDWTFTSKLWTPALRQQFNIVNDPEDGSFYMSWKDYLKYYLCAIIGRVNPTFVHTSLRMINNKRKSNYIEMRVKTAGTYNVFICQQSARKYAGKQYSLSLARLIIMKKPQNGPMQYVGSVSCFYFQTTSIQVQLEKGTYVVSAKVKWESWTDHQTFLTVYGVDRVVMEKIVKRQSIVTRFKADLVASFAKVNKGKGTIRSYEVYGYPNTTLQTYLSFQEALGFAKLTNKSSKNIKLTITYQFMNVKVIKPNTNTKCFQLAPNTEECIGFFLSLSPKGYSYTFSEMLS